MYSEKRYAVRSVLTATAEDLTSVATMLSSFVFGSQMQVRKLLLIISTATVSPTSSCVVTFWRRPTLGSDAGRVSLGTLTIPTATAAGKVYYKDIDDVVFAPGEELLVTVTTACAGAGAAGKGYPDFECYDCPEAPKNQTNVVASA